MEEKKNPPPREPEENESNVARRLRLMGEDSAPEPEEPIEIDRLANFWYHHKIKILMIAFFGIVLAICIGQFAAVQNPDVYILYAGADYITPNENQKFCDILEELGEDYNEDGKNYVQLNDLVFMTEEQQQAYFDYMEEQGETPSIDMTTNNKTSERFTYEIFSGESSLCILSESQYREVAASNGFLPLSEMFDELPEGTIDDYGIRFSETKLYQFYESARIFPEDAVIALRRVATTSAITGKKKAERLHGYSRDLFCRMVNFEYPAGYVPPENEGE